ncbi:MAG: hypothetical protein NXI08_17020 [bacterium]|nr:hypothetical protein [bacterium]
MNNRIEARTDEQYRIDTKGTRTDYIKEYTLNNKEKKREYDKEYRARNEQMLKQSYVCEVCQGKFKIKSKYKHILTTKHQQALNNLTNNNSDDTAEEI